MKKIDIGMWMYLLLCTILLCLMISCSSPRETQKDISHQIEMQDGSMKTDNRNRELVEQMARNLVESLMVITNAEVEQVRTDLSAPDSTGVQYPTAVTRTKAVSRSTSDWNMEENTGKDAKVYESVTVTSKDTTTLKTSEQIKTQEEVKRRMSWWHTMLFFIGGIIVVYISFKMFLKKGNT